jgi:hypothetical protein
LQVIAVLLVTGRQSVLTGETTNQLIYQFLWNCLTVPLGISLFPLWFRKALVRLFDKVDSGLLKEGKRLSERILDIHRKRY